MNDTAVYRAPMRSRSDDVAWGLAVERALTQGLCGVGGRLETHPASFADAVAGTAARHGERVAARLERFAAAQDGSFVWTADADGLLWLGRVTGPWRFDADPRAGEVDLVHVRPCTWQNAPTPNPLVPDAVRNSFARGGRNWQRIHSPTVAHESAQLWDSRIT